MTEAKVKEAVERVYKKMGHLLEYKPGLVFEDDEHGGMVVHFVDPEDKSNDPYRLRVRLWLDGSEMLVERLKRGRVGVREATKLLYFLSEVAEELNVKKIGSKLELTESGQRLAKSLGFDKTAQVRAGVEPQDLKKRIKKYWREHNLDLGK